MTESLMKDRQRPLVRLYRQEPTSAWVTDEARTTWQTDDPLHGEVVAGPAQRDRMPVSVHTAVGGESDAPVPGDILCAALASCLDSTARVVANRLSIRLTGLSVHVTAEVDVRGTLRVDDSVPVGFQRMNVVLDLQAEGGTTQRARQLLVAAAEHSCVVLQTLRPGVPIELTVVDTTP